MAKLGVVGLKHIGASRLNETTEALQESEQETIQTPTQLKSSLKHQRNCKCYNCCLKNCPIFQTKLNKQVDFCQLQDLKV